jgi:hypothetical protein
MRDRSEVWIAALALSACGFALIAPVVGRIGHVTGADAAMAMAAASGLASFLLAGSATLRAARCRRQAPREREDGR